LQAFQHCFNSSINCMY